jgi:hypothetical protein
MTNDRHDEKHDGKDAKKMKLDGLKKLSPAQLAELLQAVSGEVERRAKEAADKKPLSKMSDNEFRTFVAKAIAKGDHDDE